MKKPSVISLFTGAGGLDLGVHAAALGTAVAVEMDKRCCETLRTNKARGYRWEVIERRVEDVPSSEILDAARLKPGEADLLVGGPPCQPFSKSGFWARGDSGRLRDPRANTLREYLRILEDTRPRAFLLENVAGLNFNGKEEGYRFILDEIAKINARMGTKYTVTSKVVNAAWYGIPQTRERIILVGSRDGTPFRFPDPAFHDPDGQATLFEGTQPYRTAWDALGDLKTPTDIDELAVRGRWADLLPSIPEGQNYLHHTERGGGLPLFGWRRRYWSFLLKLAKNRPSWTLTAQPGPAIGPFHWTSRRLSRVELARIQTFPDGYVVEGSIADVQRQIGNAVPSLLGEVLAREIRRQLLGHRLTTSKPTLLPPRRARVPAGEPVARVLTKYKELVGEHEAHPGTGQGYGALRRRAAA
ncbi:MAG: DNA cytosine methyltransferase [Deltaproteobacteria bacterium]|nr:DNA cytosine methyltransferase [Deltaproteobacteria bacterium]